MTATEERLSELLHRATPEFMGVDFASVAGRARRRRRRQGLVAVTATVAAVAGVVLGAGLISMKDQANHPGQQAASSSHPSHGPNAGEESVAFNGIRFTVPAGWSVVSPQCGGPANHTVVLGRYTGSCPASTISGSDATAVTLSSVFGRQFALGWSGTYDTLNGQPVWRHESRTGTSTTVTLTLPWSNTMVTAQSPDPTVARSLLDRVILPASTSFAVPATAMHIVIESLAGHDGDGIIRNVTVTNPGDINALLSDLRSLTPTSSPTDTCDGSWTPRTVLLTVSPPTQDADRTFAARFDDCGLVLDGAGAAAHVNDSLLADVKRLLPTSGL